MDPSVAQSSGEFIRWFATLGVGGVLAGFMFAFYRKDVRQYTELWKSTADMLMQTVKENTTSNVKLVMMLEAQERNHLRKEDLDTLIDQRIRQTRAIERDADRDRDRPSL